ncbi:MAG: cytochrome c biogenesis protein [Candidatus Brocadiales bacterium]|nr:cytochrome c biogenesis protein [Candidatus Bathyanammoxibius amoris]
MDSKSLINLSILCYWLSVGIYTAYWYCNFSGKGTRTFVLALGLGIQLTAFAMRGMAIEYLPLTNKFESFYGFSITVFILLYIYRDVEVPIFRTVLFSVGYVFLVAAAFWPKGLNYPPPLMITIWYTLHVPLSFMCYAYWTLSFAAASAYFLGAGPRGTSSASAGNPSSPPGEARGRDMIDIIDRGFLYGMLGFSVSMLFGGLWGYVAWGSYFLWDAKVVWSVIVWLFYSACIHVDNWPALKPYKPHLAVAGFLIMLMTYVGTSFLISSSHSFG